MFTKIKSKIKTLFAKAKQYLKSRTVNVALIIAMLGVLEVNFPLLQPLLGDNYSLIFIPYAMLMVYLRSITTQPIEEK